MSEHPTPWRIQIVGKSAHVIDAERNTVSGFDPADDTEFWERIVKVVNSHCVLVKALEDIDKHLDNFGYLPNMKARKLARAALSQARASPPPTQIR